jgi:FkbM family methyltransferase
MSSPRAPVANALSQAPASSKADSTEHVARISGPVRELVAGLDEDARIALFRWLASQLGVTTISCDGEYGTFEGSIDDEVVHGRYLRHGSWSPGHQELLFERLFPKGQGSLLDVGANIGLVSIPLAERRGVRCLAFEPEPRNFRLLQRNIDSHGMGTRVEAFNLALYSEQTTLSFELSPTNSGDHRVRSTALAEGASEADAESSRELIRVPAERLDELVRVGELERPIVMKVDTQGCEVRVLKGAERLLGSVDYLICEYWPYGLWRIGDTPEALHELLRRFPYGAVLMDQEAPEPLGPIDHLFTRLNPLVENGGYAAFADVLVTPHTDYPA